MTQFLLPTIHPRHTVPHEHIIRVEASSNYSRIFFAGGTTLLVSKTLQWFQRQLPDHLFVRVHRSHLINRMHVQHSAGMHSNMLLLSNGDSIMISRRKKSAFRKSAHHPAGTTEVSCLPAAIFNISSHFFTSNTNAS